MKQLLMTIILITGMGVAQASQVCPYNVHRYTAFSRTELPCHLYQSYEGLRKTVVLKTDEEETLTTLMNTGKHAIEVVYMFYAGCEKEGVLPQKITRSVTIEPGAHQTISYATKCTFDRATAWWPNEAQWMGSVNISINNIQSGMMLLEVY